MRLGGLISTTLLALGLLSPAALAQDFAVSSEAAGSQVVELVADPGSIVLAGPGESYSILLSGRRADGRLVDLSREAVFRSSHPELARVEADGVVYGLADGTADVVVESRGLSTTVKVTVVDTLVPKRLNFANDVMPLLGRFGCNSSGCHGKAEGQNGFKLSVFGFDPAADYDSLTKEGRGRRVFPAAAEKSLLLRKVSGELPHGGGVRLSPDSREYEILRQWVAAGAPLGDAADPTVTSIEVTPGERPLAMGSQQQLRVIARDSEGREFDVTRLARFQSNNDALATVDATGLITAGSSPGQAAIMASYMASVDTARILVPRTEEIEAPVTALERNAFDSAVFALLRKLNVAPSGPADDAEFIRRAYLDVIGTLPTAEEARRFLQSSETDRRAKLVDELLARPEFNDLWALWWSDLLRVDRQALGHKAAQAYYQWIHDSVTANKPLDQFARELLTAEGPLSEAPQGHFFSVVSEPGQMASTVSQVFLGVRIACAQCHHHPFDRWGQADYYGMQAFFTQVGRKNSPAGPAIIINGEPETRHPRSGELILPHALAADAAQKVPPGDRRRALADWLASGDNDWFARNLANRLWAHFLGRGLVEPVDDVRGTNPATNPELLDALARSLVEARFDLRAMIRSITASQTYQLSSRPNASNERDEQNYSRALLRRMPAEVLYDAVCQTTGVEEKFDGLPSGYRAVQLWDSHVSHYFLKLFGRPARQSACECERNTEASVAQVLHLMNSPEIQAKLAHEGGRIARLVREHPTESALVEELYLTFYSRLPTESERQMAVDYMATAGDARRRAAEDLAWSMLNSLEFVFNH